MSAKIIAVKSGRHSFNNVLEANERLPATQSEAIEVGSDFYYSDEPCKECGVNFRFRTSDCKCTECERQKQIIRENTREKQRARRVKDGLDRHAEQQVIKQANREVWEEL